MLFYNINVETKKNFTLPAFQRRTGAQRKLKVYVIYIYTHLSIGVYKFLSIGIIDKCDLSNAFTGL